MPSSIRVLSRVLSLSAIVLSLVPAALFAQEFRLPIEFSLSSSPRQGGSEIGAEAIYRWSPRLSTTLRGTWESLNYDFEFEGYSDSLGVVYEDTRRIDLLAFEMTFGPVTASVGGLWLNKYSWEKGFFVEAPGSGFYSYQETIDFNIASPRVGFGGRFGSPMFRLRGWGVVSPVFWVIQDQTYGYTYDGVDGDPEDRLADGMGYVGFDAGIDVTIFNVALLTGTIGNLSYDVEEFDFSAIAGGTSFDDYFALETKSYTRFHAGGSASVLIPIPMGRLQLGGNIGYRSFVDEEGAGYEEVTYGVIFGIR